MLLEEYGVVSFPCCHMYRLRQIAMLMEKDKKSGYSWWEKHGFTNISKLYQFSTSLYAKTNKNINKLLELFLSSLLAWKL